MTQEEIKKLATEIVGDGQDPNQFFVTVSPYVTLEDEWGDSGIEVCDGFEKDDVRTYGPFNTLKDAEKAYKSLNLDIYSGICNVIIEDRKSGTIKEKFLTKIVTVDYSFNEIDDSWKFSYLQDIKSN